jgi:hypothetical protein
MITGNSYNYQMTKTCILAVILTFSLLASGPIRGAEEPQSGSASNGTAQADVKNLQAQLAASRKEAAKYKEIARKNREIALELKQVAIKWQQNAQQWQNATHMAQAEAQELRNKYREVNAKLHATRTSSGVNAPAGSGYHTGNPVPGQAAGGRRDGQAYGYTEIGDMTQDAARIRDQRRADVNFAEHMLREAMGSHPEDERGPRR